MNRKKRIAVVFYHANCCDGFGAYWAFDQAMRTVYDHIYPMPIAYGENPFTKNIALIDRDIYILDFSFDRATITALSEYGTKIVLIDHHKTTAETLLDWPDCPGNVHIYFDQEYSGAVLTWLVLAPHTPPHTLIQYIEDRDLWRHKLPGTHEINAVIANAEKTLEAYGYIARSLALSVGSVTREGAGLLAMHRKICNEIVKDARSCTIQTEEGIYSGLACNCSPQFASDVGNLLAIDSGTFGATYYITGKSRVKWSLRSNGDYDVSTIAKAYGGGGHKNAAGFSLEQNGGNQQNTVAIRHIPGKSGTGESE